MGHPLMYEEPNWVLSEHDQLVKELEDTRREVKQLRDSASVNFGQYKQVVEREQAWREAVRGKLGELRAECEEEMPTPGQVATNSFADGYYDGLEYAIGKVRKLERELGLAKEGE